MKKGVKIALTTLLIMVFTLVLPFTIIQIGVNNYEYIDQIEGTNIKGVLGYYDVFMEYIKTIPGFSHNFDNLFNDLTRISAQHTSVNFYIMLSLCILFNVSIIVNGFILLKKSECKILAPSMIIAGILSICLTILLWNSYLGFAGYIRY